MYNNKGQNSLKDLSMFGFLQAFLFGFFSGSHLFITPQETWVGLLASQVNQVAVCMQWVTAVKDCERFASCFVLYCIALIML